MSRILGIDMIIDDTLLQSILGLFYWILGFWYDQSTHSSCGKNYVILPHQIPTLLFYHIILQHPIYQMFYHSIIYIKIVHTTH